MTGIPSLGGDAQITETQAGGDDIEHRLSGVLFDPVTATVQCQPDVRQSQDYHNDEKNNRRSHKGRIVKGSNCELKPEAVCLKLPSLVVRWILIHIHVTNAPSSCGRCAWLAPVLA
jgi:hypothetical protein